VNAIDNNTATYWQAGGQNAYITITHAAAKAIMEFSWQIHAAVGDGMKTVCVSYHNGSGWVAWWYPATITWTSADQVQVITKP